MLAASPLHGVRRGVTSANSLTPLQGAGLDPHPIFLKAEPEPGPIDLSQICMICWRAKLSYQFAQALPKGLMVIPLKVGVSPGTSCSTFESNWWIVMIPRRP